MTTPHDYFGRMMLDEQHRKYQATLEIALGHKISVTLDWAGIPLSEALTRSQVACDLIRVREPEYRTNIAQNLLSLYNDTWRDGEALNSDGFMRRISLSSMQLCPAEFGSDGSATLYYADGELFAGHSIEVFLDADFNYLNSQIAG